MALRPGPGGAHTAEVDNFVGRAGELAILNAEIQAVRAGHPRFILVEGEAGIGKSSLLSHFAAAHPEARVLRASGDQAETLLAWGLADQLLTGAGAAATELSAQAGVALRNDSGAMAVGARLVAALGDLQADDRLVAVIVDDLHWSDEPSARALLFALRRMQADRVLGLVAARPGGLDHLGEGWSRFAAGDHRVTRLRLGGLTSRDLEAMARSLGAGDLSGRAVAQLLDHTGGNALHCRTLLEELGPDGLAQADDDLPAPRELGSVVLARLRTLSESSQGLVAAAAVLGRSCPLATAAALAGIADPLAALDEAAAAGLLTEDRPGSGAAIAFAHPLIHAAIRDDLGSARRHRLHQAAATLVPAPAALHHRVAAAVGPDDTLAGDLDEAARQAALAGTVAQAAAWLAQASAVSTGRAEQERRLLDALATLVDSADVAGAAALWPQVAQLSPSARRSALRGRLDLLCGRGSVVEAHLLEAWQAHDPDTEPLVGATAATSLAAYLCTLRRVGEALAWGERAVTASAGHPEALLQAKIMVALSLTLAGRGPEGLARLDGLAPAAAEVPLELTDGLVMRGMCRLFTDDMTGALSDLSVGVDRLRAGVSTHHPGHCLVYLGDAEYRLGAWDDALMHCELAVSLARDTDRTWDSAFMHGYAALVPAARGDWQRAGAHVEASRAAARAFGTGTGVTTAAMAGAELALARGDLKAVLAATEPARALGRAEIAGVADWRPLEAEALIGLGRQEDAEAALAELDAAITVCGLASARMTANRLHADLAVLQDDLASAEKYFAAAWQLAHDLPLPFQLALLERDDGRRLRRAGDRQHAVRRFRQARDHMAALGARPHVRACERELALCGAEIGPEQRPAWNLTASELSVARLVCTGRSNREVAAELYVSVKAVEFHLGHIFDKIGIRSRKDLASRLGAPGPATAAAEVRHF
jgi:DNA-binding CsgD family transcriptional regulator/tetratricopeptide (TPR) repeat protein